MRRLGKSIICVCTIICLCACSAEKPRDIPEWKRAHFQLMKDTLNDESRPHGVLPYYGIELYDIDNDSIPEMQELRPSASQPGYYKVWFVNNGQAKHMIISERVRSPCFK